MANLDSVLTEAERDRQRLQDSEGKLIELDDAAQADLDQMLESNLGLLDKKFADDQSTLLARLFGSGVNRSTIAGEAGGQLLGEQGLVQGQELSANAARRLGLRQFLTQEQRAAIEAQLDSAGQNASTLGGVLQSRISANAQIRSSEISADASRYGSDRQLEGTYAMASASRYGDDVRAAAQRFSASQSAGAQRFSALKQLEGIQYGSDKDFEREMARLRESMRQFDAGQDFDYYNTALGAELTREGLSQDAFQRQRDRDLERYGIDKGAYASSAAARNQRRSSTLGFLGTVAMAVGSAYAGGSDRNLKENIKHTQDYSDDLDDVLDLAPVSFAWDGRLHPRGQKDYGLIAQEVAKVIPEAVGSRHGFKTLDALTLIGKLVGAVKELESRVTELELEK